MRKRHNTQRNQAWNEFSYQSFPYDTWASILACFWDDANVGQFNPSKECTWMSQASSLNQFAPQSLLSPNSPWSYWTSHGVMLYVNLFPLPLFFWRWATCFDLRPSWSCIEPWNGSMARPRSLKLTRSTKMRSSIHKHAQTHAHARTHTRAARPRSLKLTRSTKMR